MGRPLILLALPHLEFRALFASSALARGVTLSLGFCTVALMRRDVFCPYDIAMVTIGLNRDTGHPLSE